jgi:spermidine/putrescine-binding protein
MNEPLHELRKAKLEAIVSRRYVLNGILGVGAVAAFGPFLAACATSKTPAASGSATAKLGGKLNFIGYSGEDAATVAKVFLTKNAIKMNPSFIASPDEPLTKFKTGGRGQLDIISDNKDFQRALLAAGEELYTPLDLARIPNAAGLFPAFASAEWLIKDGKVYGIPLIWGDEPCVYNPKKWSGVPAKYTDFADSKYKGSLVMVDDPVANTWAKSMGLVNPSRLTQVQLDATIAEMRKTKPNVVTFSATLGDQADVLVRGDASIAIGGWAYQIVLAEKKGVMLKSASPATDGTFYWSDAYGIALGSPNIDNAYAFINFMMSPEANAAIATELGSGATIAAAVDKLDAKTKGLYDYTMVEKTGGGVLGTQVVVPPTKDDGDIVGMPKWVKAWEAFKLG